MNRYASVILTLALCVYFLGCGKKQQTLEEMQAPMSIESMATTENKSTAEVMPAQTQPTSPIASTEAKLEPLPPSGPYKPTATEIQTALKNAGFYTSVIDGKIGPMTKKAIEEFQKANNLTVDGKVGSKTWAALSNYLNKVSTAPATKTGKAKTKK